MCTSPLTAYDYGEYTKNGKRKLYFSPQIRKECLDTLEVSCGQCIECRLEHSREWAVRMMLESKDYKDNYFVTLTYDDEHLPRNEIYVDGSWIPGYGTLDPDSTSSFMKNLRSTYDYRYHHNGIRFYCCGEYGDELLRPHYHFILFNLPINDLQYYSLTQSGYPMFESKLLSDVWKCGNVRISKVSFETCAYVARYVTKKVTGESKDAYYQSLGQVPEFSRMSRRPGIGAAYYDRMKDVIYRDDKLYLPGEKGPIVVRPPKYYDKLFEAYDAEAHENIKETRIFNANLVKQQIASQTTLPEEILRRENARRIKNRAKSLIRPLES